MVNSVVLPAHIRSHFGQEAFAEIMQMQGKIFRDVPGRKTIQVRLGEGSYFIKQHFGVGWGEILKSFFSFKQPILGAQTEVEAIKRLDEIGIPTTPLVGYGVQGNNPATQQSFIITQDLGDITSLEDVCADWQTNPPEAVFKQAVVIAMAQLAAKLHAAGLCHRDFYLCHLALKKAELAQNQVNQMCIRDSIHSRRNFDRERFVLFSTASTMASTAFVIFFDDFSCTMTFRTGLLH